MYLSMYMKKNSPFTPFVSNAIMKIAETGVKNILSKRHVISEPNCKPIRTKGRPLGRVSVQGVESLWGDCRFIPADWGS